MPINIYENEKSPCLGCAHELRDKNHRGCVNCEDRVNYTDKTNAILDEISAGLRKKAAKKKKRQPKQIIFTMTGKGKNKKQNILDVMENKKTTFNVTHKRCTISKELKSIEPGKEEFHNQSDKPDGFRTTCKECYGAARAKEYYNRKHGFLIDFIEHKDIFDQILIISKLEDRTAEKQIIHILKSWVKNYLIETNKYIFKK